MQLDLFSHIELDNPLKGKRICLTGEFRLSQKELKAKLESVGVKTIDKVSDTRNYQETDAIPPVKEKTHFFIVGSNPNAESLKRHALNVHDGYHAKLIDEETLCKYFDGIFTEEDIVDDNIEKKLNIDYSYYCWEPPTINGKTFVSRVSSPLVYDEEGRHNSISLKEIYVPDASDSDKSIIRQLIGNFGGYGNTEYFDDTNTIMLSDSTLENLKRGIKDEVIIGIENKYNKSNSKIFNIQFTCESDFINWVKKRMSIFPDEVTIALLEKYENSKS